MPSVQKTRVKHFRLGVLTVYKFVFSTGSASRNSQSKKVKPKKLIFDCGRKLDLGFSQRRQFSTDNPTE